MNEPDELALPPKRYKRHCGRRLADGVSRVIGGTPMTNKGDWPRAVVLAGAGPEARIAAKVNQTLLARGQLVDNVAGGPGIGGTVEQLTDPRERVS